MKRTLLLPALAMTTLLALPAQGFDLSNMTEAERSAFGDGVRQYLLENPEVIMEAVAVLEARQAEAQAQGDIDLVRSNADAIFDDGHSWVGGNPDGDITLVEFMDYRCGYCKRAFDQVNALLSSDGNIRFILKEFPILGDESVLASRFAIATQQSLGDEAYKAVHDGLMLLEGGINETSLSRLAESLGYDPKPILAHMDSDAVSEVIEENQILAQRLSISGTPSFVMGDQMLRGYLPADEMQKIAAEIRKN